MTNSIETHNMGWRHRPKIVFDTSTVFHRTCNVCGQPYKIIGDINSKVADSEVYVGFHDYGYWHAPCFINEQVKDLYGVCPNCHNENYVGSMSTGRTREYPIAPFRPLF